MTVATSRFDSKRPTPPTRPRREARRSNRIPPITARQSVVIIQNRAGTRNALNPGNSISSAYGPRYMNGCPISVGAGPRLNSHVSTAASA